MPHEKRLTSIISRRQAALLLGSLLLPLVGLAYLAYADLTQPLHASVTYPLAVGISGARVSGSAEQEVFRLGKSAPDGSFSGLNPKTGTPASSGGPVHFFYGDQSTINAQDFIYLVRVTGGSDSTSDIGTLRIGICKQTTITSLGYFAGTNPFTPSSSTQTAGTSNAEVSFDFDPPIPHTGQSAILFFTSPDPPGLHSTYIGGGGTASLATGAAYGPCPASVSLDQKIGLSSSGPFTDGPLSAVEGTPIYYQITIKNTGQTPLTNVTVSDPQLKNSGDLTSDFFNAPSGQLAAGATMTKVFGPFPATSANPATPSVSVNGASLASVNAEYQMPNQDGAASGYTVAASSSDTVLLNVTEEADLSVNNFASPNPVLVGHNLTYTLTVTNHGPSTATGVTLTNTLSSDVAVVSSPCPQNNSVITCNLGTLAKDETKTVTIVVKTLAVGTFNDTAQVTSNITDPQTSNNTSSQTTMVNPVADLSLTKTHTGNFSLGGTATYTIIVSNAATAGSTSGPITVTDTLPGNLKLISGDGTGWICNGAGTANVSCTSVGPLGPGVNLPPITLNVQVGMGTPVGANSITNTASVSTSDELNTANNTASDSATVNQATPVIDWSNPADIIYGTTLSSTQLNATASFNGSPVPGTFVYTPAAGALLNAGNNQTLSVVFTPTDTTNFGTASASVKINVLKATPQINWSNPADIVYGTPLSNTQLNATASFNNNTLPGSFAYTPSLGAVLSAGINQTLSTLFTPTDTTNFNSVGATAQINVVKAGPTINWSNPADIVYGTSLSNTQLNATASFNSSQVPGTFVYTPSAGTLLNAGNNQTLSVAFTPTDTANFSQATATVQINVLKATPQINWSKPADIGYGTPLSLTQLNAAASFNNTAVPGDFVYTPPAGTLLNAGSNQTLTVNFTPTDAANFNSASASVQINVLKAAPTINWSNPADIVYGTPLGPNQLNATASFNGTAVMGNFAYLPISGTVLNAGNNQTLAVTFTPTDTANFNNASASVQINVLKATPTINWSNPADIIYGTPLSSTQLNATASFQSNTVLGSFVYTPPSGMILNAGANQTLTVNFTPNDTANFNNATASVKLNVLKAVPTITWSNPADIVYGTLLGPTQLNAAASFNGQPLPGTFVYTPGAGTLLNAGSNQLLAATFTPTDTTNFSSLMVTVQINVLKATPAINWSQPADIIYGTLLGPTQLNATASLNGNLVQGTFVYTPPSGTLLNAGSNQTLAVTFTPTDTANFNNASASVQINVLKATPTINWNNPADIVYGTLLDGTQLNAAALFNGNPVSGSFVYTPPAGTLLSAGSNQTLTTVFTPTDTANFNQVTASVKLNVLKATPIISWSNPADIVYGTLLGPTQLNAAASFNGQSLPGAFVYAPPAGTLLNAGSNQTLAVTFTPTDTTNFNQATASVKLNVLKATPQINWSNPADIVYGTLLGPTQLNATTSFNGSAVQGSFVYTPPTGTLLSAGSNQTLAVTFTPTDTTNFNSASANVKLNVLKATPIINWSNPADIVYGTLLSNTQLNATASFNGNTVPGSFVYTPPAGTLLNAGSNQTLAVTFTPTDTANFNNATASVKLNVLKATPQINWSNPADIVYSTPLSNTQLNAAASFNGQPLQGSFVYTPPAGTVLNAGSNQTLSVVFTPTNTANFNTASASVKLNVLKATPQITWNVADIVYGTPLGSTQLNAAATFNGQPLPGNFVYTPPAGTLLNAGQQTLSTVFTPTDTTNFNSVTANAQIKVLKATPQINWNSPADIIYGTPLSSTQLNATASFKGQALPGTFVYTPPTGTVLNAGNSQTLSVVFTATDSANFNQATATASINVLKATPIINWSNPGDIVYGTPLGNAQLNATASFGGSTTPGQFVYTPPAGALLNAGSNQTLSVVFTPTDTANFNTVTATVKINVLKATPQITWSNPTDIVHGTALSSTQLNATASFQGASLPGTFVYTPSAGTMLNAGQNQLLSVTFTPTDTANFNTVTASVHINVLGGSSLGVSASIMTADSCVGGNSTLTVTARVTHNGGISPQLDNPGPEFTAQLPSLVTAVAGSCTATSGVCDINGSQVTWNGSVGVGQSVTITYKVKVKSSITPGSSLCFVSQAHFDSNSHGVNNQTVSTTNCVQADCNYTACVNCPLPNPGDPTPVGSVLVYNYYTSQAVNAAAENTLISITNTEPTRTAAIHLFFVDGNNCSVADAFMCLTPNQTASFLASDVDPGVSGYIVAVAVDKDTGCPVSFNFLIGDEHIKLASGHAANLPAEAFTALYDGTLPSCTASSNDAELVFDGDAKSGASYSAAPRTLALDYIPSPLDGNSTLLILNRLGGDLSSSGALIGDIFGVLYNDTEVPASFTFSGRCQFREKLSNSFPRTTPRLLSVIPSGRSGWMRLAAVEDVALLGAAINFNSNISAAIGSFNQGHNLHHLTLTTAARLTIPILTPSC